MAQIGEVSPADVDWGVVGILGCGEVRVVGDAGITADPVVVLHPPLGGEAVVVPAHRVEDLFARHATISGMCVCLDVPEDRSHVKRPRHGGGRRVDGEDLIARPGAVEAIGAFGLPVRVPLGLQAVETRLVRDVSGHVSERG